LEFQFLRPRGCRTSPFRSLSLCFGAIGKTPSLISRNNFVNKILSASAIAMSWQGVTRSSLCSGVQYLWNKMRTQLSLSHNLFQNPKNYSLGMFKHSEIILDAIRLLFLNKSATAAVFTSVRVDSGGPPLSSSSYQFPSVSKSRVPSTNVSSVYSLFPVSPLHQY